MEAVFTNLPSIYVWFWFRLGIEAYFRLILFKITIYDFKKFSPLRSSISLQNQDQFWWFFIPWKRFEVLFHNSPFYPISIINSSSDLIKFEEIIINFLISPCIRPLFTIIPLNSRYFHQISKFGLCFDTRPCEIDDLAVSSRQPTSLLLCHVNHFHVAPRLLLLSYEVDGPSQILIIISSVVEYIIFDIQNIEVSRTYDPIERTSSVHQDSSK